MKETVEEYEHLLMTCLHQTKDNVKNKLIVVIEALSYFKHHREEDNFETFDRSLAQLNF